MAIVAIAGMFSACSMHQSETVGPGARAVITADEIDSSQASNAFDAVRKLRPGFLVSHGKVSLDARAAPAFPNVYVDNVFYGDASTLRDIPAATIDSIKFYTPGEAQYKFGHGNMAGVIEVVTRHQEHGSFVVLPKHRLAKG